MSELVKRLRDEARAAHQESWSRSDGGQDLVIAAMLAEDAAAEIERLTARVAGLEAAQRELDRLRSAIEAKGGTEHAPTEDAYMAASRAAEKHRQRAEALTARLADAERMAEALEPFKRAADGWEPDDGDSEMGARIYHPEHGLENHAEFTFGDLRKARAALAAWRKGGEDE